MREATAARIETRPSRRGFVRDQPRSGGSWSPPLPPERPSKTAVRSSLAFPQGRGEGRGRAKALAGSVEQGLGERVLEFLGLHAGLAGEGEAAEMSQAFAPQLGAQSL